MVASRESYGRQTPREQVGGGANSTEVHSHHAVAANSQKAEQSAEPWVRVDARALPTLPSNGLQSSRELGDAVTGANVREQRRQKALEGHELEPSLGGTVPRGLESRGQALEGSTWESQQSRRAPWTDHVDRPRGQTMAWRGAFRQETVLSLWVDGGEDQTKQGTG